MYKETCNKDMHEVILTLQSYLGDKSTVWWELCTSGLGMEFSSSSYCHLVRSMQYYI